MQRVRYNIGLQAPTGGPPAAAARGNFLGRMLLFLMVLASLAACNVQPGPPAGAELECLREAYPCSFAEVPLEVIERSLSLAEQVAELLETGGTGEAALELLAAQPDLADAGADGDAVMFRLIGGRPMVVDLRIDAPLAGADVPPPALARLGDSLVAGSGPARSALVLAPYAFDFGAWDMGAQVAGLLGQTRGYQGRVSYRETTDPAQPGVTVDDLLELDAYDVIYLNTHGGRLCLDKKLASIALLPTGVGGGEGEDCRADFLVQRFSGTAADLQALDHTGIVLYRGAKYQSIAVTADFFLAHYPEGLADTVFVLVSCGTFTPELNTAIAGSRGVYVSWDDMVRADAALATLELMRLLAEDGITVSEALELLGPMVVDSTTAAVLRSTGRQAGGDLRIRDLVTVKDATTGDDLRNAVEISLTGMPDDGEPDSLLFEVLVDGVGDANASGFALHFEVDGQHFGGEALTAIGELLDGHTWRVYRELGLGKDLSAGQLLPIEVWVELPEGGTSGVAGSPRVAGDDTDLGTVWRGQFTYQSSRPAGDWTYTLIANVDLELEPGGSPTDKRPRYEVTGGDYLFTLNGIDGYNCQVTGTGGGFLPANENAYLRFDRTVSPIAVTAYGYSKTPPITAQVSCEHSESYTTTISSDKRLLNIPDELGEILEDGFVAGEYLDSGGAYEGFWTWEVARVQ